jgi:IS6 family transposase
MIADHHAQSAGRATLLVRAVDGLLGTHNPRVLDELIPSALHTVERYANNPVEADHGRLKARLRPMRGLKRHRSARIISAGHAFVQNLRRGHYELATDVPACHRIRAAFDQLTTTI